jgi:Fur family transcriptional regulator, ferric uptake regulator
MTCASLYTPELRSRGFRMTPQRLAIMHVLHHSGRHLSPGEVYQRARRDLPGLTEPTVYRTLEFLAENGMVHPTRAAGGHRVYQMSGSDHHHLICRTCGEELEVKHSVLDNLYRRLRTDTGFQLTDSHMTFFGLCPKCQNNN